MRPWGAFTVVSLALGSSSCTQQNGKWNSQLARERLVSAPSGIAFLSTDRASSGSSGTVRFGGPLGRSALYLKFPSEWRSQGIPQQAFLALFWREGSASSDQPVALEVWRINADWQPETLQHWSEKPSLGLPYARARVSASPARDLRIDVTELVRFAAQNPERDFGVAVIASGSDGPGLTFSTGLAGGLAPRLELYFR